MIRYLTAGESHGQCLTGIIEGVPSGLAVDTGFINQQLHRRNWPWSAGAKIEKDRIRILRRAPWNVKPIALRIIRLTAGASRYLTRPEGSISAVPPRPGRRSPNLKFQTQRQRCSNAPAS
jgi:chorismate synthase